MLYNRRAKTILFKNGDDKHKQSRGTGFSLTVPTALPGSWKKCSGQNYWIEVLPVSLLSSTLMLIKNNVIVVGWKGFKSCHCRFCFQRFIILCVPAVPMFVVYMKKVSQITVIGV